MALDLSFKNSTSFPRSRLRRKWPRLRGRTWSTRPSASRMTRAPTTDRRSRPHPTRAPRRMAFLTVGWFVVCACCVCRRSIVPLQLRPGLFLVMVVFFLMTANRVAFRFDSHPNPTGFGRMVTQDGFEMLGYFTDGKAHGPGVPSLLHVSWFVFRCLLSLCERCLF